MGILDFFSGLFSGPPYEYKSLVNVLSKEVPMCPDQATAESMLRSIADRLSKGNKRQVAAGKGLTAFIASGGAKYFVKK